MKINKLNIDSSWTLFLDRDGVINKKLIDDYVLRWEQFEFLPFALDALRNLSFQFSRIIIVTNQQGIGKGRMTEFDLKFIHQNMINTIVNHGGRIDRIYFSPHLKEELSQYRKPGIGMALNAKTDFPGINFKKSIMVGDSVSDLRFGYNLRMYNVFISSDIKLIRHNYKLIDFAYKNLFDFSIDLLHESF